jgi:hypothetical protein
MRLYVGITDGDWYESLAARPGLDEVNFWQPSGGPRSRPSSRTPRTDGRETTSVAPHLAGQS